MPGRFADIDELLVRYEQQEPAISVVVNIARALRAAEFQIDAERYVPDRSRALKTERRRAAVDAIVVESGRLQRECEQHAARQIDDHAKAEHQRVNSTNGHAVDPQRISAATSPAEISVLLTDAQAADVDSLKRTWAFCEPRLREMARKDQQMYRQPNYNSAFTIYTIWQARVAAATSRAPDASEIGDAARREWRDLRARIIEVAGAVDLGAEVDRGLRLAALPEDASPPAGETPTFIIGSYWQQNPK